MASPSAHPLIAAKPVRAHHSRRGNVRAAAIIPVELVFSQGTGNVLPARSVDIGMGGMCVQTESIIDAQDIRAVRVPLNGVRFEFEASSRWTVDLCGRSGPLTGLVFDRIDENTKTALWDYIQKRGRDLGLFLGTCEGLDQLNFEEALELALATRLREVRAGDLVYRGGNDESSSSICALMKGSVLLEPIAGRCNQTISKVSSRELFGGLPVSASCVSFERAVAVEDSTVLEFSGYAVENLLNTKPHLGVALLRATSFHWMRRFAEVLDRTMET